MALTERTEIGQRTILPDGQIMVRTDTIIERDGVEISRTYHRDVIAPGDSFVGRDTLIVRVANAEHTPEVVAAYQAAQAARDALENPGPPVDPGPPGGN